MLSTSPFEFLVWFKTFFSSSSECVASPPKSYFFSLSKIFLSVLTESLMVNMISESRYYYGRGGPSVILWSNDFSILLFFLYILLINYLKIIDSLIMINDYIFFFQSKNQKRWQIIYKVPNDGNWKEGNMLSNRNTQMHEKLGYTYYPHLFLSPIYKVRWRCSTQWI